MAEMERERPEQFVFDRILDMQADALSGMDRLFRALAAVRNHALSHCLLEDAAGRMPSEVFCVAIAGDPAFGDFPQDALIREAKSIHRDFMSHLAGGAARPPFLESVRSVETKDLRIDAHGGGWRIELARMAPMGIRNPPDAFPAADVNNMAVYRWRDRFKGVFVRKDRKDWAQPANP